MKYIDYLKKNKEILEDSDFSIENGEVKDAHISVRDKQSLRSKNKWKNFTI